MQTLDRVSQLQHAMAAEDVDALVLRLPENVLLVTGWYVQLPGLGMAVVPREGSFAPTATIRALASSRSTSKAPGTAAACWTRFAARRKLESPSSS